jgi:hypothetical protein
MRHLVETTTRPLCLLLVSWYFWFYLTLYSLRWNQTLKWMLHYAICLAIFRPSAVSRYRSLSFTTSSLLEAYRNVFTFSFSSFWNYNIRHISSHKMTFAGLEPQWYITQPLFFHRAQLELSRLCFFLRVKFLTEIGVVWAWSGLNSKRA